MDIFELVLQQHTVYHYIHFIKAQKFFLVVSRLAKLQKFQSSWYFNA